MDGPTDMEIVQRVADGDTEAFGLLVERYSAAVYGLSLRIVGDPERAEEVAQEAFVRAYEHLGEFRGASAPATWLYRIACNCALSECRRAKRRFRPLEAARGIATDTVPEGPCDEEELCRMRRALERLSPPDRALVALFYEEGRPVDEIAGILGLTSGNIKVRLHRIRERIRQDMQR